MDNTKLNKLGIIFSNDRYGNPQIQRIDNVEEFQDEHDIEYYIPQLRSDKQARQIIVDLVIDNYMEKIQQDLVIDRDQEFLYNLLSGTNIVLPTFLADDELLDEARELSII